jgi:hypothetical protein
LVRFLETIVHPSRGCDAPARLRVGDYRVRFLPAGMTLTVVRVRNRR